MLSPSHFLLYPKGYYCLILKSNKSDTLFFFLKRKQKGTWPWVHEKTVDTSIRGKGKPGGLGGLLKWCWSIQTHYVSSWKPGLWFRTGNTPEVCNPAANKTWANSMNEGKSRKKKLKVKKKNPRSKHWGSLNAAEMGKSRSGDKVMPWK